MKTEVNQNVSPNIETADSFPHTIYYEALRISLHPEAKVGSR
jgi:hypothetical protein